MDQAWIVCPTRCGLDLGLFVQKEKCILTFPWWNSWFFVRWEIHNILTMVPPNSCIFVGWESPKGETHATNMYSHIYRWLMGKSHVSEWASYLTIAKLYLMIDLIRHHNENVFWVVWGNQKLCMLDIHKQIGWYHRHASVMKGGHITIFVNGKIVQGMFKWIFLS